MGTSQIIAGLKGELLHTLKGISNDALKTKNEYIVKLLMTLDGHQSVENGINANESLSQAGKLQDLKKLGTETTAPALKWAKIVIKEMQEKNQRYESQFNQIDSGIKDLAERMPKFVYLWGKLDMLDPNERIKQFLQSAEQDQVVVLAAMLENPFGPMVTDDLKQRALTERAKRLTPRDFENFEQNELLLEFLVAFRDWIGRWLNQEVGVEIPVLRANLGDEVADFLTTQVTGIPAGV